MTEQETDGIPAILDRCEGEGDKRLAVFYIAGRKLDIPAHLIKDAKEGMWKLVPDPATTERETEKIEELQRELRKR